ncbi:ATP-binding protein [uncultured Desulfobacter sp.]|uniref:ATP-binding protein n=1 Tax=uncultured Desulfobacter sp. TaxID=240139 RepID=UPI003749DAED
MVLSFFFDKYATFGKSGGTGLGTYSAKLFTQIHGGQIEMDSSDTSGTTITVRFPARPL